MVVNDAKRMKLRIIGKRAAAISISVNRAVAEEHRRDMRSGGPEKHDQLLDVLLHVLISI